LRRIGIILVVLGAGLLVLMAAVWPRNYMGSRDIGCANAQPGRSREICRALSDSMEWTWMGHAIISPGWRITWDGLARVWCAKHIPDADLPVLESLRHVSRDWRLESAADDLIHIAEARAGRVNLDGNSVFNPNNPSYILKGGCPAP
jgi:hypothetical protein